LPFDFILEHPDFLELILALPFDLCSFLVGTGVIVRGHKKTLRVAQGFN